MRSDRIGVKGVAVITPSKYKAFLKVVELGSFSQAARSLSYSQPAVSHMVASVENTLGVRLLDRTGGVCVLTDEGRALLPTIEKIVEGEQALLEQVERIVTRDERLVRIGSMTCVSNEWIPNAIRRFIEANPNVEFEIRQGSYDMIQEWLDKDAIDMGFANPDAIKRYKKVPLIEGTFAAVLPLDHPLAAGAGPVPLEAISADPLILFGVQGFNEPVRAFQALKLEPNVRFWMKDALSAMFMVEAGLGVGVLPSILLEKCRCAVAIRPTAPVIERTISLVYKDRLAMSATARAFMDRLMADARLAPRGLDDPCGTVSE